MKILFVHNKYINFGGEDYMFYAETENLKKRDVQVLTYIKSNSDIERLSIFQKANLALNYSFNDKTYKDIVKIIKREKPDICHCFNLIHLISPSVYYACKECDIPIAQSLHNYRPLCVNGKFFREGRICFDCLEESIINSVDKVCYRNSKLQTLLLANSLIEHKDAYKDFIDAFIAPSEFVKSIFFQAGYENNKIFVRKNFLLDEIKKSDFDDNFFLFVGRKEKAKGFEVFINAARILPDINFMAVGADAESFDDMPKNLKTLGELPRDRVLEIISRAAAVVIPSLSLETFSLTALEALAFGKPIIASKIGALPEICIDQINGFLFEPGNVRQLAEKISALNMKVELRKNLGFAARKFFDSEFNSELAANKLLAIYQNILIKKRKIKFTDDYAVREFVQR